MNIHRKEWRSVCVELETPVGTYEVERLAEGYTAQLRLPRAGNGYDAKPVSIDVLGRDGSAEIWPTMASAQAACLTHHRHMVDGASAQAAALMVMASADAGDYKAVG